MMNRSIFAFLGALPATTAPIALSGRVVDADGEPLAEAAVRLVPILGRYASGERELAGQLEPEPAAETATDRHGTYRLEVPAAGMFRARIDAEGYVPLDSRLQPLVESGELPTAELIPDAGCTVRVTDPAGKPLAAARLRARVDNVRWRPSAAWEPARQRLRTDAEGKARVARGADQTLVLHVHHPDYLESTRDQLRGAGVTIVLGRGVAQPVAVRDQRGRPLADVLVAVGEGHFALATTDAEGRVVVPVPPRGEVAVYFEAPDERRLSAKLRPRGEGEPEVRTFDLPPLGTLDGRTVDATSLEPLAGTLVWVADRPAAFVRSDRGGSYHLGAVEAGETYLRAAAAGYFPADAETVATAGAPSQGPTLPLEPAAALPGRVVDEAGDPIASAEITATFQPGQDSNYRLGFRSGGTSRSDAKGRFRIRPLVPGEAYRLVARKPGYAACRRLLSASPPGEASTVELLLRRGRTAFGRVVDEDTQPLAGAEVTLTRQEAEPLGVMFFGDEEEAADHLAMSGQDGGFEIADLGAGRFVLAARAPTYGPITVPGIEIPEGAGRFDLGTLVLTPGVAVEGRVVDPDGEPVAEAEVVASTPEAGVFVLGHDDRPADAITAADGYFVIPDRKPGEKVDLTARRAGFTPGRLSGVEAPTAEPVVIALEPASRVSGRVVDPEGRPIAAAQVVLRVQRRGGMMMVVSMAGRAETDAEGRFTIEDVAPGTVNAMAMAEGFQSAERANVEVPRGRDLEDLEIVLRPGAVVAGTVRGPHGRPVVGATVGEAGQARAMMTSFDRATTDGDGHYRLSGIEPGRRTLRASHRESGQAARTIDVEPGENRLDFTLESGYEVSGRVIDAGGEPVSGATVRIGPTDMYWWEGREERTDVTGAFELTGVPDGSFRLTATHPAYAESRLPEPLVVDGQPVRGLELRLIRGATIQGHLIGLDFDELAGCTVAAWTEKTTPRGGDVDFEGRFAVRNLKSRRVEGVGRDPERQASRG